MKTQIPDHDEAIEERIAMEIIVDTYDEAEQAMGWYYYLEDTITFPFNAEVTIHVVSSPLSVGDIVKVVGMADTDVCRHDMLVAIQWNGKKLAIPLKQIKVIDGDNKTHQAIGDWHYWIKNGYNF